MPAQDMLDVLHYLFESDSIDEQETQDAKRKMRGVIYGQLYERPYTWGSESADTREFGTQDVASGDVDYSQPTSTSGSARGGPQLTHKPYIPPTPVDPTSPRPFGTVLDAPLR
jgi:hypothetical protein